MKRNNIKEFSLYLVVGGVATLTEWICFFIFDKCSFHYAVATLLAYVISTFVNWLVGRLIVFKQRPQSVLKEILSVYLASVIGLLLNLAIMWVAVDLLFCGEMPSKMMATAIVFTYNFLIRKLLIYKSK